VPQFHSPEAERKTFLVKLPSAARGTTRAQMDLTLGGEFIPPIVLVSNPSGRAMVTSAVES